ncbi:hypothetical protein [Candidatus Xenohaliotis californiensis]
MGRGRIDLVKLLVEHEADVKK